MLAEFGTVLTDEIELVVYDSNADMRYLVLPEPPNDLHILSPAEIDKFVTRDRLIGVIR